MKSLLALTTLAIGLTTVSHAANGSNGSANFSRVERSGISVLMPGNPQREVFTGKDLFRTEYAYNPTGLSYRVSVVDYTNAPNSDYASVVESIHRSMKAVKVIENKPMSFSGVAGRFTQFETSEGMTIFYWVATRGTRGYQLIAVHERGYSFNDDAKVMFESFRVTE